MTKLTVLHSDLSIRGAIITHGNEVNIAELVAFISAILSLAIAVIYFYHDTKVLLRQISADIKLYWRQVSTDIKVIAKNLFWCGLLPMPPAIG